MIFFCFFGNEFEDHFIKCYFRAMHNLSRETCLLKNTSDWKSCLFCHICVFAFSFKTFLLKFISLRLVFQLHFMPITESNVVFKLKWAMECSIRACCWFLICASVVYCGIIFYSTHNIVAHPVWHTLDMYFYGIEIVYNLQNRSIISWFYNFLNMTFDQRHFAKTEMQISIISLLFMILVVLCTLTNDLSDVAWV